MATRRFLGQAVHQKQVATIVVADTWAQNDTVTVTVNGLDLVITIGTLVTTAQVATTIKQAINGETLTDTSASCVPTIALGGGQAIPAMREVTATVASSTVTLTAVVTGTTGQPTQPFTLTVVAATAGTGDVTYTNAVTAHESKHEADNADNWSGATVPVDGDTIVFDTGKVDCRFSFASTFQPLIVTKYAAYTGKIGLGETNKVANNQLYHYPEYRTKYITFDDNLATCVYNIEYGEGSGSGRVRFDAGAGQALFNVFKRGPREDNAVPCVLLLGSHASNELNNPAGDVGIAFFGGETATLVAIQTGNGPSSSASTICGAGVTLSSATVAVAGGEFRSDSAIATVNQTNGKWYHGLGTITAGNIDGGIAYPLKNAAWTTLELGSNGTFDTTLGTDPFVITNAVVMRKGAKFIDPQGRCGNVSFTLQGCDIGDVTIRGAAGKVYTITLG